MKPFYFYIICVFLLPACHNGCGFRIEKSREVRINEVVVKDEGLGAVQKARFSNPRLEAKIADTLRTLSFVKESDRYIDSFSNHTHGIAFMIDSSGEGITVTAGYNGPSRFETYYNFTVNPDNFEIKVLDVPSGDLIAVREYIKKSKQAE